MDEYMREREKYTKTGVGTQRAVETSQKWRSWTPGIGKGVLRIVSRQLLGASISLKELGAVNSLLLFNLLFARGNECCIFFANKDRIKDT